MKKHYILKTLFFISVFITFSSCGKDDDYKQVSPVTIDLTTVPYEKLSQYNFFEGEMKNLEPAYKVLPYDLNSTLFTDYAHKKRFVWMPEGTKATYTADNKTLNFPNGTVLIKNFYYDSIQPANTTRIIETRLMIKKTEGWIFADYIWNEAQTEATLDMRGSNTNVTFKENGITRTISYRIPEETECFTCHKNNALSIPIGPKPQNLNKDYVYSNGSQNQLSRWITEGYLDSAPSNITSTIDWTDETKPLDLRVRSYLDINCAHCHSEGAHCSYRVMRFAFSESANPDNLGVCIVPQERINSSLRHIISKQSPLRSALYYRINTTEVAERMPLMGRTIIHTEAVAMIEKWIEEMDTPCP